MKVQIWRTLTITLLLIYGTNGSVFDFVRMIKAVTDRSARDFSGYANFCGVGGRGAPLDNIDRCCQSHDRCLSRVNRSECFPVIYLPFYIINYRYMVVNKSIFCYSSDSSCQRALCECDRVCAECFRDFLSEYNPALKRSIL